MIAWAVDTLIGVSLMLMLVLAVRRPVAQHLGARWAYALWLLPLARAVLPPLHLFPAAVTESLPAYSILIVPGAGGAVPAEAAASGLDWIGIALALWAGGVLVFAFWQQANYSAFLLSLGTGRRGRPPEHGGIKVVESDTVDGPLALGFVNPRIVVPSDFHERYSPAERALALEHELIHHRRGDLWWNLAALVLLAANWFNPIAWIAFRAFRNDQELACDAAVARRIGGAARHAYACALVKSASRPGQIAACPLNSVDQLKLRLGMMSRHDVSRLRAGFGFLTVTALAVVGLALSAAGFTREGEPAFSTPMMMAQAADSAVIAPADLARLQESCGQGPEGPVMLRAYGWDGEAVCANGVALAGAEVDAIVQRAVAAVAPVAAPSAPAPSFVPEAPTVPSPPAALKSVVAPQPPTPPAPPAPPVRSVGTVAPPPPPAPPAAARARTQRVVVAEAQAHGQAEALAALRTARTEIKQHSVNARLIAQTVVDRDEIRRSIEQEAGLSAEQRSLILASVERALAHSELAISVDVAERIAETERRVAERIARRARGPHGS